jgi:hypothetical protein
MIIHIPMHFKKTRTIHRTGAVEELLRSNCDVSPFAIKHEHYYLLDVTPCSPVDVLPDVSNEHTLLAGSFFLAA